jgi:repressor LexA
MEDLADIQQQIWVYIRKNVESKGFPPTLREIGDKFDIRSTNGVRYHLRILEKKGYIQHKKGSRRGIQLLNRDGSSPFLERNEPEVVTLPTGNSEGNVIPFPESELPRGLSHWWKPLAIIGRVAAGEPIFAEENVEDEIGVDQALFGGGPGIDLFGLRISGDSMVGVGIHDGDLAVVMKRQTARPGEIVVATVNDEATVKRYLPQDTRVVLKAENPDYTDIIVTSEDRFRIVGTLVGLIRRTIH